MEEKNKTVSTAKTTADIEDPSAASTVIKTLDSKKKKLVEETIEPEYEKIVELDFTKDLEKDYSKEKATELTDTTDEPEKVMAKPFDISSINVINKNELEKNKDLVKALSSNKSAFQIVAAQSGYVATVKPLTHKDTVDILYGNLGRYEYRLNIFETIWNKIYSTSIGKVSFDDWLKITSVEDIETFYYGVYCATFPNEGTFNFTCPHCGEERNCKITHGNLIKTADKKAMRELISKVSRESDSPMKMKEFSLVGKMETYQLSESKIVVELRTPSLWNSLELLKKIPEDIIDKDTMSVTNMLYINRILVANPEGTGYSEYSDRLKLLNIIDNLSISDAQELHNTVFARVNENRISYSIKNIKCPSCGKEINEIPISIEDILFTLIFEKTQ